MQFCDLDVLLFSQELDSTSSADNDTVDTSDTTEWDEDAVQGNTEQDEIALAEGDDVFGPSGDNKELDLVAVAKALKNFLMSREQMVDVVQEVGITKDAETAKRTTNKSKKSPAEQDFMIGSWA